METVLTRWWTADESSHCTTNPINTVPQRNFTGCKPSGWMRHYLPVTDAIICHEKKSTNTVQTLTTRWPYQHQNSSSNLTSTWLLHTLVYTWRSNNTQCWQIRIPRRYQPGLLWFPTKDAKIHNCPHNVQTQSTYIFSFVNFINNNFLYLGNSPRISIVVFDQV
jgi:hypothetical protein